MVRMNKDTSRRDDDHPIIVLSNPHSHLHQHSTFSTNAPSSMSNHSNSHSHSNHSKNTHNNNSNNTNWTLHIQEGVRRVRAETVARNLSLLTGVAGLGGFLFGYDTGVISGALLPLQQRWHLTTAQQEVLVSSTVLAAFVSSLCVSQIGGVGSSNNHYSIGRRATLLISAYLCTIGACILAGAFSYSVLVLGRVVVGCGIGLASVMTPLYIAELAPQSTRGRCVTLNGWMCTFGQFSAGMINGLLFTVFWHHHDDHDRSSSSNSSSWRVMLGLAAIPALVMAIGFHFLPETPRYLLWTGRHKNHNNSNENVEQALAVLKSLRESDEEAMAELDAILRDCNNFDCNNDSSSSSSIILTTTTTEPQEPPQPQQPQPQHCTYDRDHDHANDDNRSTHELGAQWNGNPLSSDTTDTVPYGTLTAADATAHETLPQTQTLPHTQPISLQRLLLRRLEEWRTLLADAPTRRALMVGCGLMVIQQCSGINTVMYYAATIYKMNGDFTDVTSVWLSGFTALAQVLGLTLSLYWVDSIGRRTLVLWSLAAVTLSLMGLATSFYLARVTSAPVTKSMGTECSMSPSSLSPMMMQTTTRYYCYDCAHVEGCGYCASNEMCIPGTESGPDDIDLCSPTTTVQSSIPLSQHSSPYSPSKNQSPYDHSSSNSHDWVYHHCSNPFGFLCVAFMVLYLFAFGIGMGGLPWTINAEIYPLRFRSGAVSVSTATNWICNFAVARTFLTLSAPQMLGAYGAFTLYSVVAMVGWIFLYGCLPETKGVSLEDMDRLFQRPLLFLFGGQNASGSMFSSLYYDPIGSVNDDDDEDDEDDDDDDDDDEDQSAASSNDDNDDPEAEAEDSDTAIIRAQNSPSNRIIS